MPTINYPTVLPDEIHAGDSLLLEISGAEYPSSDFTATIILSSASNRYEADATAYGSDHRFNVSPSTTQAWAAGRYSFQIIFTATGYQITHSRGSIKIIADIANSTTGVDVRAYPRRISDALESIIEGRADNSQLALVSQSCEDLNINYLPDVYKELRKWQAWAKEEEDKTKLAANMGYPKAIYTRFSNQ